MDQKMTRAKKVAKTKNQFFHDLSNLNEELLTFQSGFMPTPSAKRSKNKTSSEGKITHRRIRVRKKKVLKQARWKSGRSSKKTIIQFASDISMYRLFQKFKSQFSAPN